MGSPGKKQFPLRLDPALWEEIERLAAIELRSSNAQIELLLREALKRRGIKPALSPTPRRGRPPAGEADAAVEGAEGDEGSGIPDASGAADRVDE
ncbi:hypothetical protein [Mitsuaria sp. 7]|uniref:hypothetical protein n=1 Tax=Mitsuaria sp. 7 TaxID=1658665 RepID=UPI000A862351|nr:hypothetical protein [Mitsuaria sp. 7]